MVKIQKPLVSISLATYNRPEGLRKSLDCFVNQTYRNIEIIVSDNCSIDDPTDIVKSYGDSRIKFFRQTENIGMKNNGMFIFEQAEGDLFILGSDDDWWHSTYIEELVRSYYESEENSVAFCDFIEVDINNNRAPNYPDHYPLLKEFDNSDKVKRLESFILQKENQGKANVHRGLCNKDLYINTINKLEDLGLGDCWAFDQLMVFILLIEGKLSISNKLLFKCTVGNTKHYDDPRSKIRYLEAHNIIMNEMMGDVDCSSLRSALDIRYLDEEIGFKYEYLSILRKLVRKSSFAIKAKTILLLEESFALIEEGKHRKAVVLAKEALEQMKEPKWINAIIALFANDTKKKAEEISKKMLEKVTELNEKN